MGGRVVGHGQQPEEVVRPRDDWHDRALGGSLMPVVPQSWLRQSWS
jgi:hypothetical protein